MPARFETIIFRLALAFLFLLMCWILLRAAQYAYIVSLAVVLGLVVSARFIPADRPEGVLRLARYAGVARDAFLRPFTLPNIVWIAFVLRLVWAMHFEVRLFSDYEVFFKFAERFSQGDMSVLGISKSPVTILFYGVFFKLFGSSMLVVHLLNAALGALQAALVYSIADRMSGSWRAARFSGAAVAVFPSAVTYANLPNSEGLFITLLLLIVWQLVVFAPRLHKSGRGALTGMALLLALETVALPLTRNSGVLFGSWIVFSALLWSRSSRSRSAVFAVTFLVGAALFLTPQVVHNYRSYGYLSIQSSKWSALNFLSGTNVESGGRHNEQDSSFIKSRAGRGDENWAGAVRAARQRALARIRSDVPGFIRFALTKKFDTMWCDDTYGVNRGRARGQDARASWRTVSQRYYVLMIAVAMAGMFFASRCGRRYRMFVTVAGGVLFITFLLHVFIEVQSRYHLATNFLLPLLAAALFSPGPAQEPHETE
jgi:hypothetical protein